MNKVSGKVPEKMGRKSIIREIKSLRLEMSKIMKREQDNFRTLFFVTVRMREIAPDDHIFTSNMFNENFRNLIDQEVERRKEAVKAKKEKESKDGKDSGHTPVSGELGSGSSEQSK